MCSGEYNYAKALEDLETGLLGGFFYKWVSWGWGVVGCVWGCFFPTSGKWGWGVHMLGIVIGSGAPPCALLCRHFCLAANVIGSDARGTMRMSVQALKRTYETPLFPQLDSIRWVG